MIEIPQGDTSISVPFPVLQNYGNFPGDPNATPTVKIVKNGANAAIDAAGKVLPVPGTGLFCFWPAVSDVDTPGPVAMIISAGSDIVSWPGYFVSKKSFWQNLTEMPENIATAVSLLQRLVAAQRA